MDLATTTTTSTTATATTFYEDLVAVMSHAPFQHFIQKHMDSWSDAETSLMFMKLYQRVAEFADDHEDVIHVIDKIMNDRGARRKTIDNFKDYQQGKRAASRAPACILLESSTFFQRSSLPSWDDSAIPASCLLYRSGSMRLLI
jgi:hypothetical protein